MRLRLLPLLLAGVAGVAHRGDAQRAPATASNTRLHGSMGYVGFEVDVLVYPYRTELSADSVWARLPQAFAELDLPAEVLDAKQRMFGTMGITFRRRVARALPSRYLDCGRSNAGKNADNYTVWMRVLAVVEEPEPGRAVLRLQVHGSAADAALGPASASRVNCTSTGRLEERIAQLVTPQAQRLEY